MSALDLLPWLNLLLPAIFYYVVRVEHRVTRLEDLPRRVGVLESRYFGRRAFDAAAACKADLLD